MSFKMKSFEQITTSMANWTSSRIDRITDFVIGSKIRTIMESVALELEEIYWRTYNSLFEAQTEGVYGVFEFPRQPAFEATGTVTFYKDAQDPGNTRTLPIGTQVAAEGDEQNPEVVFETQLTETLNTDLVHEDDIIFQSGKFSYFLSQRRVYEVTSITGIRSGGEVVFEPNNDYILIAATGSNPAYIKWLNTINSPDDNSEFKVSFKSLSVDVPVIALETGTTGNVSAERINLIKGSLANIDGVINHESFTTGRDLETDSERQARFANYIEGLSRGTIESLRFAAFNRTTTYKISSAVILEQESLPGFVTMYVADSTGSATDEIVTDVINAVEQYRGAGMVVTVKPASRVSIDVKCRLRIKEGFNKEVIRANVLQSLTDHLSQYTLPKKASASTTDDTSTYTSTSGNELSTVYMTNIDYTIKNARPDAIIEADISFGRSSVVTLDLGAVSVDKGGGLAGLPSTGHGFPIGEQVTVNGSVNYDGTYVLHGDTTSDELVIAKSYVSEQFTGTEIVDTYEANPFISPQIADIRPVIDNSIAEIFRTGTIEVSVWIVSVGDPSDEVGEEGDYYENVKTGDLFKKESGTWVGTSG